MMNRIVLSKEIAGPVIGTLLLATVLTINNNNNSIFQTAVAQATNNSTSTTTTAATNSNTTNIDTFHAKGTINSMASPVLAGRPTSPVNQSDMWMLGGTWNLDVIKGNLQDFRVNNTMVKIDGNNFHTHSIERLRNVSGFTSIPLPSSSSSPTQILLSQKGFTAIKGIADINTDGKLKWKDVPVIVYLINGNVLNMQIDATKTNDHFQGLPVFGTVTSLTDQNNKQLDLG